MENAIIDKVKQELERTYKYDFSGEFWTDESMMVLIETVEATQRVLARDFAELKNAIEALDKPYPIYKNCLVSCDEYTINMGKCECRNKYGRIQI